MSKLREIQEAVEKNRKAWKKVSDKADEVHGEVNKLKIGPNRTEEDEKSDEQESGEAET